MKTNAYGIRVIGVSSDAHQPGDYIVPSSNEYGKQLESGSIMGGNDYVDSMSKKIAEHAIKAKGASRLPARVEPVIKQKTKKGGKKDKVEAPQPAYTSDPLPAISYTNVIKVEFKHPLGRIKLNATDVLVDSLAIGLVFRNEDEMTFIPNAGENLSLVLNGVEEYVFFPGIVLTWTDQTQKIMMFIKSKK